MVFQMSGPWGSSSPTNWNLGIDPSDEIVSEVIIYAGFIVDGIEFVVADRRGKLTGTRFGGCGGSSNKIKLSEGEYIMQVSGTYGVLYSTGGSVIASIKIHTNCNPVGYGPYGLEKNCRKIESFSTAVRLDYAITGFFGRSDSYLESIGVCLQQKREEQSKRVEHLDHSNLCVKGLLIGCLVGIGFVIGQRLLI